jgi:DNA-binding transcriptional LysR family regulator
MPTGRFAEYLETFVCVIQAGSFSAAGRRLGLTPSAVARQVDALENQVNTLLFHRTTRLLSLTDAGKILEMKAQKILDDLEETQAELSSSAVDIKGSLRVACGPTFGKMYVLPVLEKLAKNFPKLQIELDFSELTGDPTYDRFDVLIRIGHLSDSSSLTARIIAEQTRIVCASPEYLQRFSIPKVPSDLLDHKLIDKLRGTDLLCWRNVLSEITLEDRIFRCDDFETLRLAALGGIGIVHVADWLVHKDIRDGRLVHILPESAAKDCEKSTIYALRSLKAPSRKANLFIDSLIEHIGTPPVWRNVYD